jgi:hypothetical protein
VRELVSVELEVFDVLEACPVEGLGNVSNQGVSVVDHQLANPERLQVLVAGPTLREVGKPVDTVVERAGEGEVVAEQLLDDGTIARLIGAVVVADPVSGRRSHHPPPVAKHNWL